MRESRNIAGTELRDYQNAEKRVLAGGGEYFLNKYAVSSKKFVPDCCGAESALKGFLKGLEYAKCL